MKLYHGTNINFANIDLAKCLPFKDFGRGFYLTPAKWRARVRALDKVDKEHSYDIVIGPVADDGVITSIALYESQVIGRKELLNRIKEVTPYTQYAFCTQKAIEKLHRI